MDNKKFDTHDHYIQIERLREAGAERERKSYNNIRLKEKNMCLFTFGKFKQPSLNIIIINIMLHRWKYLVVDDDKTIFHMCSKADVATIS